MWLQHLAVLLLVAGCVGYVAYHASQSLAGRRSKIGQCCAKGCASDSASEQNKGQGERLVFIPVEALSRRRK